MASEWERLSRREKTQRVPKARRRSQMVCHLPLSRHCTLNVVLHTAPLTRYCALWRTLQVRKGGGAMVLLDVALTRASHQRDSTTVNPQRRSAPGTAHWPITPLQGWTPIVCGKARVETHSCLGAAARRLVGQFKIVCNEPRSGACFAIPTAALPISQPLM